MRFVLVLASALLVQGCNGVLGLDSTHVEDRDNDGIVDSLDNCPDLENPDQLDIDEDGVGDACDPCIGCVVCSVGPQHDEDGDTLVDGCDNCPTIPNLDQANDDGDDLGNACDPDNTTMQRRVLFDGFGSLDDARWVQSGPWHIVDDALEPVFDAPLELGYQLTLRSTPISGGSHWTVETVFQVPAAPVSGDEMGVFLMNDEVKRVWSCQIFRNDAGTWGVANGLQPEVPVVDGAAQKIILSSQLAGSTDRHCELPPFGDFPNFTAFGETYPLGVSLFTRTATRFDYIEVIE